MELWLTVSAGDAGDGAEVCVDLDPQHTIGELATALAEHLGTTGNSQPTVVVARTGRALEPNRTVADSDLLFGDVITLARASAGGRSRHVTYDDSLVRVAVVGGPQAGNGWALGLGEHTIGRSRPADLIVDDGTVSRVHCRLTVQDDDGDVTIWVEDENSANGTFLEGVAVDEPTEITAGTLLELGHNLLRVDRYQAPVISMTRTDEGIIQFNRPPRVTPPPTERIFKVPSPPVTHEKGRIPLVSALGALVLGAPMLAIGISQGQSMLIAMGAVSMIGSPVLAFASYGEDRRSGKGAFRKKQMEFYETLADTSMRLQTSLVDEVRERRRASPDLAELADRARGTSAGLWERRPDDDDFLAVAGGWADQPSTASIELGDGGDPQLRAEAGEELSGYETARNVPIVVDIARAGVVGLSGPESAVEGLARSLMTQLAALHSPRDLILAVAVPKRQQTAWSWTTWLPHLRSPLSPINGRHLVVGEAEALPLFEQLTTLVRARRSESGNRLADSRKPLPAIVVFVSEDLEVPRTAVTQLLEEGSSVNVYAVWMGGRADHLPGECGAVLSTQESPPSVDVLLPGTGERVESAVLDQLSDDLARDIAVALAPIKDVTAGGARGQIPNSIGLLQLLDMPNPTAGAITSRWSHAGFGVDAPVGMSSGGEFILDMRHDGPHALIGGTTGAGKSELLQSFVAALAASHPPTRVTFLLVDYKGGAAFKDAVDLPHTVGFVTDLDLHLVNRALISLNAELRRREHLLAEHDAKDLLEMERRVPHAAPPSLLLIVDEFASLAKELPDFVDGVVNVAQRGRSLGIHLILATQRPAGSINDNVRANTNLRIALRMNDAADSEDVINSRDASMLPRTLPGRAFARTGQAELTEVQIAYAGGHTAGGGTEAERPITVSPIELGQVVRTMTKRTTEVDAPSDLQVLVSAIGEAAVQAEIPPQQPPWLPPLPAVLPMRTKMLPGVDRALIGTVDLPDRQAQIPWAWDLEDAGSIIIYGTSGSGKTTLLRTMAVSLAWQDSPDNLHIYGLDFASRGLGSLEALPHVGSVVPGDDIERVQRLITTLEREIARRKGLFAEVGASVLSEYRRAAGERKLPRIVVLFDGYGSFVSSFDNIDFGSWIERMPTIVGEGRPLGIHFAIAADRRTAIGMALATTVASKVVFRMADDDDYPTIGLDSRIAKAAKLEPGRGFVGDTVEVQAAIVSNDPAGDAQVEAVENLGAALRQKHGDGNVPVIRSLPLEVPRDSLPVANAMNAVVGIGQTDLGPVGFDLLDGNVLIAGPNRSGRSTALCTIAVSLSRSTPDAELYLLAPRRSPLLDLDIWTRAARGANECDELATELLELVDERIGTEAPIIIIVDDGTEITDSTADAALEKIIRRGRDVAMSVVGAGESSSAMRTYSGWIPEIRKDRRAFLLNPDPDIDGDLVGVRLPRRAGGGLPPGRGYLCLDGLAELAQVAN